MCLGTIVYIATRFGGIFAAGFGLYKWHDFVEHRKAELRFQQAKLAKTIIDEVFTNKASKDALRMLDNDHRKFNINYAETNSTDYISHEDVIKALSAEPFLTDSKSEYIYECFGELVFYFDRIESFIQLKILDLSDVKNPMDYYVKLMRENKKVYEKYIQRINTNQEAFAFLSRYEGEKWGKVSFQ